MLLDSLLLFEQQHRLHQPVEVDLHAAVVLVDLSLEHVGHLFRLLIGTKCSFEGLTL